MATEVLVNDGGAPSRILPFTAGSAISAGRMVTLATDGEVDQSGADAHNAIGVAMVDATSGNILPVVTGKGVICNVACSGTIDEGKLLDVTADGVLITGTDATIAASGTTVGVAMTGATLGSTVTLLPVLMRNYGDLNGRRNSRYTYKPKHWLSQRWSRRESTY